VKSLNTFLPLTGAGSDTGYWQASVTAEDSRDWTEAGTGARSPVLTGLAGASN